jgi:hypothetical protein
MRRVGRPPLGETARQLIAIQLDAKVLAQFRKEARGRRDAGEVDVVAETGLASTLQEANESGALLGPRPPSDDNDDPVMGSSFRQHEEVIAIAGHQQAVSLERELKHQRVCGLRPEHVANA